MSMSESGFRKKVTTFLDKFRFNHPTAMCLMLDTLSGFVAL